MGSVLAVAARMLLFAVFCTAGVMNAVLFVDSPADWWRLGFALLDFAAAWTLAEKS